MTDTCTYRCCNPSDRIAVVVIDRGEHLARLIDEHRRSGTPVLEVNGLDAPLPVTMPHDDQYSYVGATGPFSSAGNLSAFRPGPVGVVIAARRARTPAPERMATLAQELRCHAAVALETLQPTQSAPGSDRAGVAQAAHFRESGWEHHLGAWQVVDGDSPMVVAQLRRDGEHLVLSPRRVRL